MRKLLFIALFVVVALVGCTTPSIYGDARVIDWKKEEIEKKFPDKATTKAQVFAQLGKGTETKADDLTRWEYRAEKTAHFSLLVFNSEINQKKSVVFVFDKNDVLLNKVFEGF